VYVFAFLKDFLHLEQNSSGDLLRKTSSFPTLKQIKQLYWHLRQLVAFTSICISQVLLRYRTRTYNMHLDLL
jgi:hypothetical protein